MRIRQIKPGWWLDKDLRKGLNADQREFYIGLWMLADDDGWLVWDIPRIAAELYPYDTVRHREQRVTAWSERLQSLCPTHPHLVVMDCGHARIPKLAEHQRSGGRPVFTVRDVHGTECARAAREVTAGRVGKGRERNGSAQARETGPNGQRETTTFHELMAANGIAPGLQPVATLLGSPMSAEASASLSPLEADDG